MIPTMMTKTDALKQFGNSIPALAKAVGASYQAVYQWPENLTRRISDRVELAILKKDLPPPG